MTPDDLRAYYDQHRDQYRVPEQVKVSHILIKTPLPGPDGKVDEKGVAEAQHRAEDLLKQLKSGAKFEDVAKKYSEDPGQRQAGRIAGLDRQRPDVPEFEKAAFSLPKGQISDLVKSSYGFHIIRVDDKQEAHMKTLDEVKSRDRADPEAPEGAADRAEEGGRAAEAGSRARSGRSRRRARCPGDHLGLLLPQRHAAGARAGAAVYGCGVQRGGEVAARCGSGIAGHRRVPVAGGEAGLQRRRLKRFAAGWRKNSRTSAPRPCCRRKFRNSRIAPRPSTILKRAAKELGATMKTSDFVLPDGQVPDVGSMSGQAAVAFTMKPGEISGPINNGANAVVLQVLENQQPTEADYAAKRDQIRDQLLLQQAAGALRSFRFQPGRRDDEIGQDQEKRGRDQGTDSHRQRAGNVAAVIMSFPRAAGILLHPTSLPSRGGIGDFGPAAYRFVDFLASARQGLWQVLPLGPLGYGNSPYSSTSAFAGNPLLISLERLAEHGWIDSAKLDLPS